MKLNFKYIILCFLLFSYVSTLAQVKMSLYECRIQAVAYNKELIKASYQKEESFLNYGLKYADVIEQTDVIYWNLAAIDAQVSLAIKYIAMLSSLEIQMLNMFELGLIPTSERLKVSVQKNETDLNLIRVKNRLRIAKMYLNKILGKALDTDIQPVDQLSTNVSEFNFGISLDEALSNRSELKILEKQVKISEYNRKIIKSEYLPQIGVGASYTTMFTNKTENDGNLQTSYSGQISIPIFNWSQSQHKQKAARMRIRQLETELDNTSDLITLEFLEVGLQINDAFESIILAKKSILEAEESLKETKASFDVGLNNTTDLLNAQADWQQANTQLIVALVQYESLQTK